MADVVRVRFKVAQDGRSQLVLCGKTDSRGNTTCPGIFGVQPKRPPGPPIMRINGILRRDARGVYQPTPHARKQRADGRPTTLRRSRVHGRDYGPQGERAGEIVRDFPIMAICPRCLTPNEIRPFNHSVDKPATLC